MSNAQCHWDDLVYKVTPDLNNTGIGTSVGTSCNTLNQIGIH